MRRLTLFVFLLVIVAILGGLLIKHQHSASVPVAPSRPTPAPSIATTEDLPPTTIIAQNLDTPWAIGFLSDKSMLVTQRNGKLWHIQADANTQPKLVTTIAAAKEIGEGGLLGIAISPNFAKDHFVYLYYTYNSTGNNTNNRVVRMMYENNTLSNEQILVDAIPGASNHNGGRLAFGPDGYLYISTGDAQEPSQAQNTQSLAGKILRVTPDGKAAPGNPFNNRIYSYGHRNVQGIAWDKSGQLWATEHGRSGVQSGLDELNKIEKGKNFGWPVIQGSETRAGMVTAVKNSGASLTWAPGDIAFVGDQLFFTGLRGVSLYETELPALSEITPHFNQEFGRLREVILGPDGMLYVTTSNLDGRGVGKANDDKIIRVNPAKL